MAVPNFCFDFVNFQNVVVVEFHNILALPLLLILVAAFPHMLHEFLAVFDTDDMKNSFVLLEMAFERSFGGTHCPSDGILLTFLPTCVCRAMTHQ